MLASRTLCRGLIAAALVAWSAGMAQAGGGAGTSAPVFLTDCYLIDGSANSPYTLKVNDESGTHVIRLGKARLVCTSTVPFDPNDPNDTGWVVARGPVLNDQFNAGTADHIKCYEDSASQRPKVLVSLVDPLSTETVQLRGLSFVCIPATLGPPSP